MPRLVVEKGADKGKQFPLNSDRVAVGRDATCQIMLADSLASRHHFDVERRAERYFLVDLGSMNGTYLNHQRVLDAPLSPGDKIQVGETVLSFAADQEESDRLIGGTLGKYEILSRIGRGGMGTVYRATQLTLGRIVALKMLARELTKDRNFVEMFLREARAAAQFNHPNVVQVYDADSDPQRELFYFSMEFLPGGSLQDLLSVQKKFSVPDSVRYILDAARGLEYAERKGVVHRDIKPDNLMIDEDGRIKIGDLGLALSLRDLAQSHEHGVFGTPHYVAPEQALKNPIDHRADLYALGATFYRIVTGQTPFQGNNIKEIIFQKVAGDPPPVEKHDPAIPGEICQIIQKLMRREPVERYGSAREVVEALDRLQSAGARAAPGAAADSSRAHPPRPMSRTVVGVVATVLALGVIGLVLVFGGPSRPEVSSRPAAGGPSIPAAPGIDPAQLDEVCGNLLRLAEEWLPPEEETDPEKLQGAILRFEKVSESCAGTSYALESSAHIEKLRQRQREREADELFRGAEELAEAFRNALAKSADRGILDSALPVSFVAVLKAYEQVSSRRQGTLAASRATLASQDIEETWQSFQNSHADMQKLEASVAALLESGNFHGAKQLCAKTFLERQHPAFAVRLNRLHKSIQQKALSAFLELKEEADACREAGDFARGIAMIEEARNRFAESAWEDDLEQMLKNLAEEKRQHELEEEAKLLEAEERLSRAAWANSCDLVQKFDLRGSEQTFHEVHARLSRTGPKRQAETWRGFAQAAMRLKTTLAQKVSERKLRGHELVTRRGTRGEVAGVEEERVTLAVGQAQIGVKWTEVEFDDLLRFLRTAWPLSAPELLDWSALAFLGGNLEAAREVLPLVTGSAGQSKGLSPEALALAKDLEEELSAHPDAAEWVALARFSLAEHYADKEDFPRCQEQALTLLRQFAGTEVVRKNRAALHELILRSGGTVPAEAEPPPKQTPSGKSRLDALKRQLQAIGEKERGKILPVVMEQYQQLFARQKHFDLGVYLTKAGDAARGFEHLQKAGRNAESPEVANGQVFLWQAICHTILGRKVLAARALKRAEQAAENLPSARAQGEQVHAWQNFYDLSRNNYFAARDKALREPGVEELWALNGLYEEAIFHQIERRIVLRQILEAYPDSPQVRSGECLARLADSSFELRDFQEALDLYQSLQRKYPEHPRAKGIGPADAPSRIAQCRKELER